MTTKLIGNDPWDLGDLAGNARNPLLQTPWQPTRKRVAHRNNPENRT